MQCDNQLIVDCGHIKDLLIYKYGVDKESASAFMVSGYSYAVDNQYIEPMLTIDAAETLGVTTISKLTSLVGNMVKELIDKPISDVAKKHPDYVVGIDFEVNGDAVLLNLNYSELEDECDE
ncbi:hypothetical protein [Proteus phage 10]|uniref:hypothetical protein n=1 Tax=Proteus mirabilis TaxID=584 RepID=UPI0015F20B6D|nr:hypothetical protein [Proteus phage 10]